MSELTQKEIQEQRLVALRQMAEMVQAKMATLGVVDGRLIDLVSRVEEHSRGNTPGGITVRD